MDKKEFVSHKVDNMKKYILFFLCFLLIMTAEAVTNNDNVYEVDTFSYWTAQGQEISLPAIFVPSQGVMQLTIPSEAVAVDLRRQQPISAAFIVDAKQANPNCLYYLNLLDNTPRGLDKKHNVIKGLEAESIKVIEGYDYYCPQAFYTQFISYLMTPSYDNPDDELRGRGYSETLVLPFYPR